MASLDARIAKLEESRTGHPTDEQLEEILGPIIAPALRALLQARDVCALVDMHERFRKGADTDDDRALIAQIDGAMEALGLVSGAMEALGLVASIDAST